jgi:hypothetical protein
MLLVHKVQGNGISTYVVQLIQLELQKISYHTSAGLKVTDVAGRDPLKHYQGLL